MSRSLSPLTDAELFRRISRSTSGKAGYKQLIRELGLGGGKARRLLLEQLSRMTAQGTLRVVADGIWGVPTSEIRQASGADTVQSTQWTLEKGTRSSRTTFRARGNDHLVSGRLEVHRDGFGFVRPENLDRTSASGKPATDIFIPPLSLHGAMHGDFVLVDVDPPSRDGRPAGKVARVLTRRNQTVVGVFHYDPPSSRRKRNGEAQSGSARGIGNYVQPWDERLREPIVIPEGAEQVSASAFSAQRTLGQEAHASQRHRDGPLEEHESRLANRWALEGMVVEAEITRFAQGDRPAIGRILEVLGPPDGFGVDVEIVIRKHAIPHTFPAHVLAEAEESAQQTVSSLTSDALQRREDFRGLQVVTIDGETARDFDDAVHVRPLPGGHTELQVHIADVSHYVSPGSAVDLEARFRGTSVYFPDRAVPMLPHSLSSGVCSLLPEEDRLVLSCVMEIDVDGEVVGYRVAEGVIRSSRRLTYTSVQHCLNSSPQAKDWNQHVSVTQEPTAEDRGERERLGLEQPDVPSALDRMLELALRLNAKRVRRGSIDFDLPEPVVEFDPEGNMKAIVRSERGWAHRLIEEFMLSANECVATWLTAQRVPSIYRIHETPDPKRIVEFEETAAAFGETLGIGALPVRRFAIKGARREAQRRTGQDQKQMTASMREIPDQIPVTPQMYQRLVRRIAGRPEERILSYLMLRSLKQARYAEKNEGHFALASHCYTHFTSPIRRYPDLIVHRLVRAMLLRGADPRGGPVRSTDPQPWQTAQARSPRPSHHASLSEGSTALLHSRQMSSHKPSPEERPSSRTQGRREGRIGWSGSDSSATEAHMDPEPEAYRSSSQQRVDPISAAELAEIAVESSQAERRAADAERELVEWKKMKFMADKVGEDFSGLILSVTKFGFFVELDELFIEGLVPLGSLIGDFYSFRDADRVICGARTGHCFRVGDRVEVILDRIDRQQRRLQFALVPGTEPANGATSRSRMGRTGEQASGEKVKRPVKKKGKSAKRRKR